MSATEKNISSSEADLEAIKDEARPEIQPDNGTDVEDLGDKKFSFFIDENEMKENTQKWCCPHGIETHTIPLLLVLIATSFTFAGSWDCSYFRGASTGFTGNNYGLWTIESKDGICQPWDVLFFSYSLGDYLEAARALSMTAMILGLSLLTAMSQALECYLVSWGVGFVLFALFITSLAVAPRYNFWTVFFFFLYVVLVLIVRSLFKHPVHRAISSRGSKYIAWLLILNFVLTILTLLVLNSIFCQCRELTNEKLEGRLDPTLDPCDTTCELGPAGVTIIFGAAAWLLAGLAVFKFGVQPDDYVTQETARFSGYQRGSMTTKVLLNLADAKKHAVHLGKNAMDGSPFSRAPHSSEMNADEHDGDKEMNGKEDDGDEEIPVKNEDLRKSLDDDDDDDDDQHFQQTCCQKICCDFRVTERTRKEKTLFWCFRLALVALYVVFAFAVVILIGSRFESGEAERSPSTAPNFITNITCAFNPNNTNVPFVTYPTPEAAKADGMAVAHCGPCGDCSNMEDIETFLTTRKTITHDLKKKCSLKAVLGSTDDLDNCVAEVADFTDKCRTCWVKNMQCDTDLCVYACMKTLFMGFLRRNNVPESGDVSRLNWCLHCDERRCGTAFVTCSGVARRRMGIRSDIERDPDEVCPHVTNDWLKYTFE